MVDMSGAFKEEREVKKPSEILGPVKIVSPTFSFWIWVEVVDLNLLMDLKSSNGFCSRIVKSLESLV